MGAWFAGWVEGHRGWRELAWGWSAGGAGHGLFLALAAGCTGVCSVCSFSQLCRCTFIYALHCNGIDPTTVAWGFAQESGGALNLIYKVLGAWSPGGGRSLLPLGLQSAPPDAPRGRVRCETREVGEGREHCIAKPKRPAGFSVLEP